MARIVAAVIMILCGLGLCSGQGGSRFTAFRDYQDYDDLQDLRPQRGQPGQLRESADREPQRETTTPVPILKQINEHNEDGSYTYGYEGADGSFKLETRFKDGTVQGKYGYVDVNGEVKIIEYGANAMGFQPEGDLPEGIVIPPPVQGNCTECDYDYDYDYALAARVQADKNNVNRARNPANARPVQPNQNRGLDFEQPVTPARPEVSRPVAAPAFSSFPRQQAPAAPARRPAPQRQAAPQPPQRQPAPARQASGQQSAFSSFPAQRQPAPAPQRQPSQPAFLPTPAAPRQSSQVSLRSQSRAPAPVRAPEHTRALPSRLAANAAPTGGSKRTGGGGGSARFSNFPARKAAGEVGSRPVARAPAARAPAPVPRTPAPVARAPAPVPRTPAPAPVSLPAFTSFAAVGGPSQNAGRAAASPQPLRQAAPQSRPALTFQDSIVARPPQPAAKPQQRPNIPKSALEIFDFDQLVQEFQGSRARSQAAPSSFPQRPAPSTFQQQQRQPAAASPSFLGFENFPVKY